MASGRVAAGLRGGRARARDGVAVRGRRCPCTACLEGRRQPALAALQLVVLFANGVFDGARHGHPLGGGFQDGNAPQEAARLRPLAGVGRRVAEGDARGRRRADDGRPDRGRGTAGPGLHRARRGRRSDQRGVGDKSGRRGVGDRRGRKGRAGRVVCALGLGRRGAWGWRARSRIRGRGGGLRHSALVFFFLGINRLSVATVASAKTGVGV